MEVSRYSFACQKAIHLGLRYARGLGHRFVEVEHVALALLRHDVTTYDREQRARLEEELQRFLDKYPKTPKIDRIEYGPRLMAVFKKLEGAEPNYEINARQFWEGLVRGSTALQINTARLRQEHVGSIDSDSGEEDFSHEQGKSATSNFGDAKSKPANKAKKLHESLRKYTVDLTDAAVKGEIDPVIGRDEDVRRVMEILGRKKKNNPILLGEPGIGKTAIAEALAMRIAAGRVPEGLKGKKVLSLDLVSLMAGAKYRGEFEERMQSLLEALRGMENQAILFVDEIHHLVGAGNPEGAADAAGILKPALARGEVSCLGATTIAEFKKFIERDAALERRFQPVMVEEPSSEAALSILRGLKQKYEAFHGVKIGDDALVAAVELTVRYVPERRLPDKAIDVLDEACSKLRLEADSSPHEVEERRETLQRLEIERQGIEADPKNAREIVRLNVAIEKARADLLALQETWRSYQEGTTKLKQAVVRRDELESLYEVAKANQDFAFAARLQYGELPAVQKELARLERELQLMSEKHSFLSQGVGRVQVAKVVEKWTGIPAAKLSARKGETLATLEERLRRKVFGQDLAISLVAKVLRRVETDLADPARPLGVFLFLGPTGVGKTELARAVASEIFHEEDRLCRIDMSEFMEAHNVARLIGAPPGYVGFGEGGQLTEFVRRKPFCVVLFDEIEKAHPKVLDILLQLLEDGRLTDATGRVVNFRNVLFIMTSNLKVPVTHKPSLAADEHVRQALAASLRPELVNRIDQVVVFNKLAKRHLEFLVNRLLGELNQRLQTKGLRLVIGPLLKDFLVATAYDSEFGGRSMRRSFQSYVVDQVTARLAEQAETFKGAWILDIDASQEVVWSEESSLHKYLPLAK